MTDADLEAIEAAYRDPEGCCSSVPNDVKALIAEVRRLKGIRR